MGTPLGLPTTTALTADYQEVLKINHKKVGLVVIQLVNLEAESADITYKISGRYADPVADPTGADDTYDFDLPKDEGEETEATEFTLAAATTVRELVEEPWEYIIVKAKGDGYDLLVQADGNDL